jgi:hypothetical protein
MYQESEGTAKSLVQLSNGLARKGVLILVGVRLESWRVDPL